MMIIKLFFWRDEPEIFTILTIYNSFMEKMTNVFASPHKSVELYQLTKLHLSGLNVQYKAKI